jgi:hypothetical protein
MSTRYFRQQLSLISWMFQHTYFYVAIHGMGPNVRNIQHKRGSNVCLENNNISKFEFSKVWAETASSVKWPGNMLDNRKIVVRSPLMEGLFFPLQRVQIRSWTHPASYSMRIGELPPPPELRGYGTKLTTRLHLVQRLTTREAVHLLLHMLS